MPGWHEEVKDQVKSGELVLLGITQEQHAERCRLFAQWKGFDWPILHDPINWMESAAVPITTAIDEHGVVRSTRPSKEWVRNTFLTTDYPAGKSAAKATRQTRAQLEESVASNGTATAYRELGDAAMLWFRADPDVAVDAYRKALELEPNGTHHFRLGVALRRRYETADRRSDDFAAAVSNWTLALDQNPNQYIWRRRIQQYGPRLAKPYPFYDWVDSAIADITKRGETPVRLSVGLSGAEVARPAKEFEAELTAKSPDPRGRIHRDDGRFAKVQAAVVPAHVKPGESVRLHLEFSLAGKDAQWNNEAEPLLVWIEGGKGWVPRRQLVAFEGAPPKPESSEVRRVEVELQSSAEAADHTLEGYALYYVCEKSTGTCLFRRLDFSVQARVHPAR